MANQTGFFVCTGLSLLLLTGCLAPARQTSLRDLARLPSSEGFYGGSMLPSPPWLYFGSDGRYHYFRYMHTEGNRAFTRRLKIPRSEVRLSCETPFTSYDSAGVEVVPLYGVGRGVYGFVPAHSARPEDFDWTLAVPALPRFDEKL